MTVSHAKLPARSCYSTVLHRSSALRFSLSVRLTLSSAPSKQDTGQVRHQQPSRSHAVRVAARWPSPLADELSTCSPSFCALAVVPRSLSTPSSLYCCPLYTLGTTETRKIDKMAAENAHNQEAGAAEDKVSLLNPSASNR